MISETRSPPTPHPRRGWVSSGREAAIQGGPLTHVFAGSLASFAVPLLTLLRALCRAAPVFGQPADTWVIIQRGSHTGTQSAEDVYIYSANLFPEVREWSLVVATIARLAALFERGLLGQWSCVLRWPPGLWFNEGPRTDILDTGSGVPFPNPSAAHQTHRLRHPFRP